MVTCTIASALCHALIDRTLPKKLTDRDVLSRSNVNLAKGLGVTVVEAAVLRLGALGIKLRDKSDAPERKTAL